MSEGRSKMRVSTACLFSAALLAVAPLFAATTDVEVAKKALRDDLLEIARARAEKSEGYEAKTVILESYAREEKWDKILSSLDSWALPPTDAFVFYRAQAEGRLKGAAAIESVLSKYKFSNQSYARSLAGLLVQMLLRDGDARKAKVFVEKYSLASCNDDFKVVSADVYKATGDSEKADALWREVVASTNSSHKAFASAACSLGDTNILKVAYSKVEKDDDLRKKVGLKLGTTLLASPETFSEGQGLIVLLVNEAPGADGARESLIYLAERSLDRNDPESAARYFRNSIEVWPAAARDYAVHDGYGWSLIKLNKLNEALLSFSRAEECATNDVDKAAAILKQGEILSTLGRGEESMAKYRIVQNEYSATPAGKKLERILNLKRLESRGRDLYHDFRFDEAEAVFDEVERQDPDSKPRMDYLKMLCLYGQGYDDKASAMARKLASECKDESIRAEATLWLAKFLYNTKQWSDSCDSFYEYATKMKSSTLQAPSALLWSARAAFASNDFAKAIDIVNRLVDEYSNSPEKSVALVVKGKALVELSRFDEAIVVFQAAAADPKITPAERIRARTNLADVLFVMGADNPVRYNEALEEYKALYMGELLNAGDKINLAFKMARTLEKLEQMDLALDRYYGDVVCAYRDARERGEVFNNTVKSNFARAAFRLCDEYERRRQKSAAENILRLVIRSDVKASVDEARRRLRRIKNER